MSSQKLKTVKLTTVLLWCFFPLVLPLTFSCFSLKSHFPIVGIPCISAIISCLIIPTSKTLKSYQVDLAVAELIDWVATFCPPFALSLWLHEENHWKNLKMISNKTRCREHMNSLYKIDSKMYSMCDWINGFQSILQYFIYILVYY